MVGPGRAEPGRREAGFTLIELVVVIAILGLVVVGLTQVLLSIFTTTTSVKTRVSGSDSAFLTSARFQDDVNASVTAGTVAAVARDTAGCGGVSSLLRLASTSDVTGKELVITSYDVVTTKLERRTCTGSTLPEALAASPHTVAVVTPLGPGANPVTIQCQATTGAALAPAPPAGDTQCRLVTMKVTTIGGYAFTLKGLRSAEAESTSSTRLRQCTLVVEDNANVYQNNPTRNYNDRDDYGGTDTGSRSYMEDRNRSGSSTQVKAYFRFDLSRPCYGRAQGEPAFLPANRTLTSAQMVLTFAAPSRSAAGGPTCPATHDLAVLSGDGTAADPAGRWDPNFLTWNTSPVNGTVAPTRTAPLLGINHRFGTTATMVDQRLDPLDVLPEVSTWYAGGVGHENNGWVLSNVANTCDKGDEFSNKFVARGNSAEAPRLVITWAG